ncbi:MAG: hypothetical protein MJ238_01605 [Bacilli bacterium]|nr:hypothetical protein [Bacilli bacterium]
MKSITILALSALSLTSVLVPYRANDAKVAPRIVYVDSVKGNDGYDGSESHPYKTLDKALAGTDDLEIHLMGGGIYSSTRATKDFLFADGHDNVSIIGEEGKYPTLKIGGADGNAYIGTNLTLDKIKITNSWEEKKEARYSIYACGNDLTFGEDCVVDNKRFVKPNSYETGIECGLDFQIFSGCNGQSSSTAKKGADGSYVAGPDPLGKMESNGNTLTFLSGDFGKITLTSRVTDTGTEDNHFKPKLVFGGTACASYIGAANDWFNHIDADITIKDEARVHRIVGGVAGYRYTATVSGKPYIYSGKTTINVQGGYVKNIIGGSLGRMSAYVRQEADTEINVSGGYVESLIGGSAAGNTYGNISINVTGGTFGNISDDIVFGVEGSDVDTKHDAGFYCGGAGMSSMIHTNWVDPNPVNGVYNDLNHELFSAKDGCYKENDILDSSKQVMAIGNVYGSIKANITKGTFNCNIHGGGKGFDYSKYILDNAKKNLLFNVAQVTKGVDLTVSGCTVNGNVYGGGAGIEGSTEDYLRIAMVAGTINLHIGNKETAKNEGKQPEDYSTVINGTVYGGGINPKVTSQSKVTPAIVLDIENTYINNTKTLTNGKYISVHGGSENASVDGPVAIDIKGSLICNDIYLGSGDGDINGSIKIDVIDSKINGNLTLGSVTGDINGDVNVLVEGLSVIQDINIGSDEGVINGKVDVTISSTSVNNNINIGTEKDSFGNDIEVTINKGTSVGGTVNDNTGDSNLDLNISEDTTIEGEMLYVQSFIRASGNYGGTARLTAEHYKKDTSKSYTYTWYKVKTGDEQSDQQVRSSEYNYIDLTPEEVGSYYCVSKCDGHTAVKSNTARFVEKSEAKGAQIGFDSTPIFSFFVELSSDFDPSTSAVITIGDRSEQSIGTLNNSLGYNTYKFSIKLAPYEMADDISISIESEGVNDKYSVKQYCKEVLDSDKTGQEMKTLVKALLNYGAAAQEYFGYETYNLANSYLKEADKVLSTASIDDEYKKLAVDDMSDDINAYSATVEILTETTIRVYFVEEDGGSFDGYKAYVTGNGVELDDVEIKEKNGRHYIEITGISAQNFNEVYTVKLAKSETEYVSVSYSVLTYCYSKQNSSDASLKKFALSLFDYYLAVQAYLGK